jgi:hypothetical protein
VASVPLAAIRIVQGADSLALYQFNTHYREALFLQALRHLHPSPAPVGADGVRLQRRLPRRRGPYELGPIRTLDGVNHPADRGDNLT